MLFQCFMLLPLIIPNGNRFCANHVLPFLAAFGGSSGEGETWGVPPQTPVSTTCPDFSGKPIAARYNSKSEDAIRFNILHNGGSVGEFTALKTVDGDNTIYYNNMDIKVKVIAEVRMNFNVQSTYISNELEYSKVDITLNGRPYVTTTTKRVGNKYQFRKDAKLKATFDGPIRYSAAMMIFGEPSGFASAYSEEYGGFHSIKKSATNVYEKQNSRGRKSIYYYQNQVLNSMNVDVGLTTVEMVLKD